MNMDVYGKSIYKKTTMEGHHWVENLLPNKNKKTPRQISCMYAIF